jgi:hypothetical protein
MRREKRRVIWKESKTSLRKIIMLARVYTDIEILNPSIDFLDSLISHFDGYSVEVFTHKGDEASLDRETFKKKFYWTLRDKYPVVHYIILHTDEKRIEASLL